MNVQRLSGPPPAEFARELKEFETPFTYPLGAGQSFRISHGEDYTLFFRSQGEGACFVAADPKGIAGVLGSSIRCILMPDGTEISAAYFCDLKVADRARGGRVLFQLARAADAWLRPKVQAAFAVVMNGTSHTPDLYTGRAGIQGFQKVGNVLVLRITTGNQTLEPLSERFRVSRETVVKRYQELSRGRYACPVGEPTLRSEISPVWLVDPSGSACGVLEDTRKAKRLIIVDDSELLSAHLSSFAFSNFVAGAGLIRIALAQAHSQGISALFVSVDESDSRELCEGLKGLGILPAPATVYGAGLATGRWNINTSEI